MTQLPLAQARAPGASFLFAGHTRIATVRCATRDEAVAALRSLQDADAAEVRLDAMWAGPPAEEEAVEDMLALVEAGEALRLPLIATLRPTRQGGLFQGPEELRAGLLAAAARAGFAAVDVEADLVSHAPAVLAALRPHAACILSQHEARVPTCDDGGLVLLSMQDRGAELDKLAFEAGAFSDTLRALELARKHAKRGGRPAIATTGSGGAPVRALLALAGNRATYGHAPASPPAAPGQPALAEVQALWDHWGLAKRDLDAAAEQPLPWLAVLGIPVLHSLSPRMLNAALRTAGRPERYAALEVPASASALRLVCIIARRIGLAGASVTAPHKADAARMGRNDAVAQAVGAANCLRFPEGEPEATNTDATALRRLLAPHVQAGDAGVVIGAGGAARAALWALRDLGARCTFTSRDGKRAAKVAADLGAAWGPWDARGELRGRVWVQAAALGPEDGSPVPAASLAGASLAVEMVYRHGKTPFQNAAAQSGLHVVDGRTVLLEQAVDAYRFWFGAEPDRDAMTEALRP